ncbi:hypothetical protein M9434_004852 [Picochlorum sp. BPE23]|nr:hypothetical protein M9434_004852 [Picochlorum sp. BPE23]
MKKAIVLVLVFATTLFQSGVSAQWAFDLSEDDDLMPSKIPGRQLLQQYSPEPIPISPAPPGPLPVPLTPPPPAPPELDPAISTTLDSPPLLLELPQNVECEGSDLTSLANGVCASAVAGASGGDEEIASQLVCTATASCTDGGINVDVSVTVARTEISEDPEVNQLYDELAASVGADLQDPEFLEAAVAAALTPPS